MIAREKNTQIHSYSNQNKMIKILFLCCATIVVAKCASVDTNQKWISFKSEYSKTYSSPAEEQNRQAIFQANLQKIQAHNNLYNEGKASHFLKINRFSDLTSEEVQDVLGLKRQNVVKRTGTKVFQPTGDELPNQVDWRSLGAVTDVKDQGSCSSGWSFSAVGAMEGQYEIQTGNLVSLSAQQLIDCSYNYGNGGCTTGLADHAFQYVKENGIVTDESYPYTSTDDGTCEYTPADIALYVQEIVDITTMNETDLQEAVATVGPVSVIIDASSMDFLSYAGGVLDDSTCGNTISHANHVVLVVGYGSSDEGDYFIVKNSWGTQWGDGGYVKMSRNKDNQCGIANLPSYPEIMAF